MSGLILGDVTTMIDNILILSAAGSAIVKAVVDLIKMAVPNPPQWVLPLCAAMVGILALLLLLVATGTTLTPQSIAQGVLAGVLAGAGAVGLTELHRSARS